MIFGANSLSGPFVILALQYDISCGIVSPCDKSAGTIDNQTTYKIYGMPASLYSGKVRSYLLKQHIPFIDFGACDSLFQRHIIPAVGRMITLSLILSFGALLLSEVLARKMVRR